MLKKFIIVIFLVVASFAGVEDMSEVEKQELVEFLSSHGYSDLKTDDLINITSLNLSHRNIREIPNGFWKLTNLTSLDLSNNPLTELPDSIGDLIKLNELYLYYNNQLRSLPDGLWNLPNLTELALGSNKSIELSKNIGKLTTLNHLFLINYKTTLIPSEIENLINLDMLTYVETMGNGTSLDDAHIYTSGNNGREPDETVKDFFERLGYTIKDSFDRNYTLEIVIDKTSCLMWQDDTYTSKVKKNHQDGLSYCNNLELAGFKDWYLPNTNELLYIANKKIFENIFSDDSYLSSDQYVGVYFLNHYVDITTTSYGNSNSEGYIRCVRKGCETVNTSENLLKFLQTNDAKIYIDNTSPNIQTLDLSMLDNITKLEIINKNITELPKEIKALTSLTHLNLTGNSLVTLPKEISNLINLEDLNLSENTLLEYLPDSFGELKNLANLNLTNSDKLKILPESAKELNSLETLISTLNSYNNNSSLYTKESEESSEEFFKGAGYEFGGVDGSSFANAIELSIDENRSFDISNSQKYFKFSTNRDLYIEISNLKLDVKLYDSNQNEIVEGLNIIKTDKLLYFKFTPTITDSENIYYLKILNSESLKGKIDIEITPKFNEFEINYKRGWNFISIPIDREFHKSIFTNRIENDKHLYKYDYKNEKFETPEDIKPRDGVWVYFDKNQKYSFFGKSYSLDGDSLNISEEKIKWIMLGVGKPEEVQNLRGKFSFDGVIIFQNQMFKFNPFVIDRGLAVWFKNFKIKEEVILEENVEQYQENIAR